MIACNPLLLVVVTALFWNVVSANDVESCPLVKLDPPLEIMLDDMDADLGMVSFAHFTPVVVSRMASNTPMVKILSHTAGSSVPMAMSVDRRLTIHPSDCMDDESATSFANRCGIASMAPAFGAAVTSLLTTGSPWWAAGTGLVAGMMSNLPGAAADCIDIVEVEIHGPMMESNLLEKIAELESMVASLESALNGTSTAEEVDATVRDALVDQIGFSDFAEITPESDVTLARVSNGGAAQYNGIGFDIYKSYSPEAQFFLNNIAADTRVPEMQVSTISLRANMPCAQRL